MGDTKIIKKTVINEFGTDREWEGVLLPGKKHSRKGPCDGTPYKSLSKSDTRDTSRTSLRVFAGSNEFLCHRLPCSIVRTDTEEMLWIGGRPGLLTVEAKIKDRDGNVLVSLERGKFYVNRNRTYRPPARDRSSLQAFDEKGNVILNVTLEDADTLIIEGQFFDSAGNHLAISSENLKTTEVSPLSRGELETTCISSFGGEPMRTGTFVFGGSVGK